MGAAVAKLSDQESQHPAFIDIGQNLEIGAETDSVKAFHTAGFLGSEYSPFLISDPNDAVQHTRPSEHLGRARFFRRYDYYKRLVEPAPLDNTVAISSVKVWLDRSKRSRLLNSPAAKSFDLSLEPKASYDIYNTGRFGLGCLLARRLVESGARFVEVTTEYIPFRYWDTHENGHTANRPYETGRRCSHFATASRPGTARIAGQDAGCDCQRVRTRHVGGG